VDLALPFFERARELAPALPGVHYSLGVAEERAGHLDLAEAHYREALRLDPRHPGARVNLGVLAMRRGAPDEAIAELSRALALEPDSLVARNNLAWLLATSADERLRDPARAVGLAEAARDAGGAADPDVLDTLAAAYAAAGRFDDAVRAAEQAAGAAERSGDSAGAERIRARADLYRSRQPYVEPAGTR
jgi:spermidine synthase